jgi:antitoxin CcdA
MTYRTTITLDKEAAAFLRDHGGDNKSAFIAGLLREERRRTIENLIHAANRDEAADADYQTELADWDVTLSDGMGDDVPPA